MKRIAPGWPTMQNYDSGKAKHIFNEANRRVPLRSPCISVHARRWKVPLAFGKARLTDRRAGR